MRFSTSRPLVLLGLTLALASCRDGTPTTPQLPQGGGGNNGGGGSSLVLPFRLSGTSGDEEGFATVTDGSGNLYVAGKFSAAIDFDPGAGSAIKTPVGGGDAFVARYNSDGTFAFVTVLSGSGLDAANAVALDGSGNVFATGSVSQGVTCNGSTITAPTTPLSAGGLDAFVVKIAADGSCTWLASVGGPGDDEGDGIATDASGNVAVTGRFNSTAQFDPLQAALPVASVGGTDVFLASYTTAGVFRWVTPIGSTGADAGRTVVADATGNFYLLAAITGTVDADPTGASFPVTGPGNRDFFLGRYTNAGLLGWAIAVGSTSDDFRSGGMAISNGNVVVAGDYQGSNTGDFDYFGAVVNFPNVGQNDVIVLQYGQADGHYVSGYHFGGPGADFATGLVVDGAGNNYVAGTFQQTINFDPNGGTRTTTALGTQDGFLLAAGTTGAPTWFVPLGVANNSTSPMGISLGSGGSVWSTGYFAGTVDFDPSGAVVPLTALGSRGAYVAQYDATGAIITR
jgi:hypothetical protein